MSIVISERLSPRGLRVTLSQQAARALFAGIVVAAALAGWVATGSAQSAESVAAAGSDLTRLLRAMAALKALMALAAGAAILWRLGSAVSVPYFALYALAAAAMAAAPGLIWAMAHVGLGALLLHGGLLATLLLLWRDPEVAARLDALVAARRAALRAR
jgi:hypothetical protein